MTDKCPKCGCEGGFLAGTSYLDKAFKFFCGTSVFGESIVQSDKCRIEELEKDLALLKMENRALWNQLHPTCRCAHCTGDIT